MYSSLTCTRMSGGLAISLSETKEYLRINHNDDDQLISSFIRAISRICESYTGLALLNQEWQVQYDNFSMRSLELPKRPVYRINFIEQITSYGKSHLLSKEYYEFSPETLKLEFRLPLIASCIRINFSTGFGEEAKDIPADLQLVIKAHIAFAMETRGEGKAFPMHFYDSFKLYNI